jgi:kynurenine formamidase
MKTRLPIVALALSATFSLNAQSMPAPRTLEEFDALFMKISNWGRWGKDDQLGGLNLITDAKRKQAAALVKTGVTLSLAHDILTEASADDPAPIKQQLNPVRGGVLTDSFQMGGHSGTAAHIDALCHILYKGQTYNGYSSKEVFGERGCLKMHVNAFKKGILTRGVLIDIPRLKGLPYLEPGTPIYAEDLEAWERQAGIKVASGDAVFVRTGRWTRRAAKGPWALISYTAGLHPSTAAWLKARDVAVLANDVPDGVQPLAFEGVPFPLHTLVLVGLGVPIIDAVDMEELANTTARLKRWEFLLTVAPLPINGGTGSPVNPIATF